MSAHKPDRLQLLTTCQSSDVYLAFEQTPKLAFGKMLGTIEECHMTSQMRDRQAMM